MIITEERVQDEHAHIAAAKRMAPVVEEIRPWIEAELQKLVGQIMRAATDDDRREIAADMRAVDRLGRRLNEIVARGEEARKNLEKWSSLNA